MDKLQLFNYLSYEKEIFEPFNNHVKIYKCGPTVYDEPHIGHAKFYIISDCLERVLKYYLGYNVTTVMNVTDLDDKIIKKGGHCVAEKYTKSFFENMDMLNIRRPDITPKVTENLKIIYDFVHKSTIKDFSYESSNGDILFDSKKKTFHVYPELTSTTAATTTIKDPRDFVLWKSNKNWIDSEGNEHNSMPGWHTECAAIAAKYCGNSIDIHLGGIDLKFPHHENEITLGRIYFNCEKWVRFCVYSGHLQIKGQKMSKSLKNFTTIEDLIIKFGYKPLAIRYLFLKYQYSKPMEFNDHVMKNAQKSYDTFMHNIKIIKQYLKGGGGGGGGGDSNWNELSSLQSRINDFLLDNLNIPSALKMLENYVHVLATRKMYTKSKSWLQYCFSYILWITDEIFGLINIKQNDDDDCLNQLFQNVKQFRYNVRHWALNQSIKSKSLLKICDDLREELNKMGYDIQDTKIEK